MSTIRLSAKKQKIGFNKKVAYVTRAVRYSTIQANDLIAMASNDTGISRAMVKAVFEGLLQEIEQMVLNGHSIQLGELGTLKFSISCKSVEDKEDLSTDLVKRRRIIFQPSTRLKNAVNRVNFLTTVVDNSEEEDEG